MKFVFFGTPEFAAVILEKLMAAGLAPAGVVCNPDRPVGRKKMITPPPTKILAQKHGLSVFQPERLSDLKIKNLELKIGKIDFAIVAAYSKIIPEDILKSFELGVLGVHPSLLPRYRGATPIQSAILAGEKETGVTLYLMDEKVDHGNIIAWEKLEISDGDNYATLENKLAGLAGNLLIQTIPEFAEGKAKSIPQEESRATFTKKFSTEDARVDLEKDEPALVLRKIRALNPEPGIWTIWKGGKPFDIAQDKPFDIAQDRPFDIAQGKRVKLLEAELSEGKLKIKILQVEGERPKAV